MRKKKMQTLPPNVPKTAEQIAFESQWNAGAQPKSNADPSSNSQIQPTIFDPKPTCSSQLPHASPSASVASILFGESSSSSNTNNNSNDKNHQDFHKDSLNIDEFSSFDDTESKKGLCSFEDKVFNNKVIPGLEMNIEELSMDLNKHVEAENIIDLVEENAPTIQQPDDTIQILSHLKKMPKIVALPNKDIPIPRFRPRIQRNMIDIDDILNEPRRFTRPDKYVKALYF